MTLNSHARWMLGQEARALMTRLNRVRPFVLHETMPTAATLMPDTQTAMESFLLLERRKLRRAVLSYIEWLKSEKAALASPATLQRLFSFLRLKFNAVLTQFDMFNDVITQRSEHEIGVWLSGLDVVSADALALRGFFDSPPVICYLDRGAGAAIRRARTRMPGGGRNPVAIIRVPRERMIGSGIASSLVHEVGHQAAALLDLVESLRPALRARQASDPTDGEPWGWWDRWISEIVADFWAVARVGIASTMGLIAIVSLPRAFVFRVNEDDPHPIPWIRVKLSAAIGNELYPHPQWNKLSALWESFYPREGLDPARQRLFERLLAGIPKFVTLLVNHRPAALRGRSLREALDIDARRPARLSALFDAWALEPRAMYRVSPSLVFAVLGQARSDDKLTPETESALLAKLLTYWALRSTLDFAAACASHPLPWGRGSMRVRERRLAS